MKKLEKSYVISAKKEKVWQALVDPEIIKEWGAGPAKMTEEEGFDFSLWGGDIWGKNTKVIKNKLLEQDWYAGKWDQPSRVRVSLKEKGGKTILTLVHTDIPDDEFEDISSGWDDYYFGPLKNLVE
ncbi:hypothetical protein A2714_00280 [Candidatus Woesebacteria bacterium RIFCSPHIGHO2_01_FULL_38_9]|uniref:Activator of Hsp90 ATPase homologue 1/2-like C-terminal domain-containing protein n=2 Tax=Candidatus Woeseibacteriota TaxID=1752722 RepID=A0A1F7Y2Y2_9BACT|nr:MAG: hypothetical protein A2714_00280 [Candidatus Woesebacteria bacterium RIFCSPHIGHO2_01_FULL_38_9]OGM58239.1 MAG: hypothetical protein A3A75_04335 [Candidatus Woesebacteria bacterium RIFCSPLOWO2_01_FULL_39_10]